MPVINSRDDIDLLAAAICEDTRRAAGLESAEQYALLDIRYATYRCVEVVEPADGSETTSEAGRGA